MKKMGLMKSHSNRKKVLKMAALVTTSTVVGATAVFGLIGNKTKSDLIAQYEIQIAQLEEDSSARVIRAYVPKETIPYGTCLNKDMFDEIEYTTSAEAESFISSTDFGRYAGTELAAGFPVLKTMVQDEEVQWSTREEEFNMFYIPRNLELGQYIDVRLRFPNGEDYSVLCKKKVHELNKERNIIYCWLNEEEILRISSAIVDAYLVQGAKLYTVTYVDGLQQATRVTYPVNLDVLKLMEEDPNILEEATESLSEEARRDLNKRIEIMPEDFQEKAVEYKDVFIEYSEEEQADAGEKQVEEEEVVKDDFY